jgi:FSR family fosmidomycin resistance protein-like MFS transporter
MITTNFSDYANHINASMTATDLMKPTINTTTTAAATASSPIVQQTAGRVLGAISFSHFLNDMIQSLILAIYPLLKNSFQLSFAQIGLITLTYQVTASILQPLVGLYTDKHPKPYSLALGMSFTMIGLLTLSMASSYGIVLFAAALVGTGSSIFHPESSRVARMASGGRHGFAQSVFQVGGNAGSAMGPLLAALIIIPNGQSSIAWFSLAALLAIVVLWNIGTWTKQFRLANQGKFTKKTLSNVNLPQKKIIISIGILLTLVFSKYFYMASISSYFTFYLIHKFQLTVQSAQIHLFIFLFSVAVGTLLGGVIGDRVGRKKVIWISILGVAPFTLALPYADLFWTSILTVIIGVVLASAFSAIIVFAQELVPGKVGAIAGLFFGFAFGMGGIGAASLGKLADITDINFVYHVCSFLPLIGLLAAFLPDVSSPQK